MGVSRFVCVPRRLSATVVYIVQVLSRDCDNVARSLDAAVVRRVGPVHAGDLSVLVRRPPAVGGGACGDDVSHQ